MTKAAPEGGLTEEEWADILYGDRADPDEVDEAIEAEEETPADDFGHASWHWRQADLDQAIADRYAERFVAEIAALEERRAAAVGPHQARADWHRSAVEAWHRAQLAADPKFGQTVKFPSGGASQLVRQQPIAVGDRDDERLMAWCEEQVTDDGKPWSALVYRKPEPQFMISELSNLAGKPSDDDMEPGTPVKLYHPGTGEVVPGIQFVSRAKRWQRKN